MSDYNVEQLLKKISELEAELTATKKYGLVWDKESTLEDVVLLCEKNLPILTQIKDLRINAGDISNCLIEGDNFHSLTCLNYILQESFDLIYIDPPYNTENSGFGYNDSFNHSTWLTFMKTRLELSKRLLSANGTIFIFCDDYEQAYLRVLMDGIWGRECYSLIKG